MLIYFGGFSEGCLEKVYLSKYLFLYKFSVIMESIEVFVVFMDVKFNIIVIRGDLIEIKFFFFIW